MTDLKRLAADMAAAGGDWSRDDPDFEKVDLLRLIDRTLAAERVVEAARAAVADRYEYPDVAGIRNALDEYARGGKS